MASLKIRPALFILLFFLLCFALRVVELLVIRTDQSIVGEAFIHKLLGIALLAGALWFWRLKWRDIGFRGDKAVRGIAFGLLFGVGAFAIAYGVELFVQMRGGGAPSLSFYATSYGLAGNSALQSGLLFILICVIGNIINVVMEDGVFRGLFMRLFGEKRSFVVSMILSSVLFGIWHGLLPLRSFLDGEQSGAGALMSALLLIVTSFVFGVELCLLCKWEGSLWAGMTVHFINNASVNLLHVVTTSGVDELQTVRITIAQTILFVAALALVLAQWRKGRNRLMNKYDPSPTEIGLVSHPIVGGGVPDAPHCKRETGRRGRRPLRYIQATEKHTEQVIGLVQKTIKAVYPNYYPKEVVDFFCNHHGSEAIETDIKKGNVWILFCDSRLVGTGCSVDNHITRVFVLPTFQGKGYGSYIMRQLENEIGRSHSETVLDASLPGVRLYEKLGYKTVRHEKLVVENDAALVYEVMKKELCPDATSICYNGKFFIPKVNTENGEADKRTVFSYRQTDDIVSAEYAGGDIIKGCLLGAVAENGELDFHYQHINSSRQVRIGKCHSVPHILDNGKLELHEEWQWLNGDKSTGSSVVVEQ